MTEDEYSIAGDLSSVRSAKAVLREICPECGSDSVKKEEWQNVMQVLMRWESRLNDAIDISDS